MAGVPTGSTFRTLPEADWFPICNIWLRALDLSNSFGYSGAVPWSPDPRTIKGYNKNLLVFFCQLTVYPLSYYKCSSVESVRLCHTLTTGDGLGAGLVTHFTLYNIRSTLQKCTTYHTLHTAHYPKHTAHSHNTAHTAHCILHTTHCILHTTHRNLHTTHCSLHTAHCTLQTAHCIK